MGLFVIVALVMLLVGVFLVGDTGSVFGERYHLVTLMNSAAGLARGAAVQVAGQPVGQVDHVQLIPPEKRPASGEAVAVWLAVDREIQTQVREDSKARIRTQGLLGDKLIDIDPGSPGARVLRDGDTIAAAPELNYQEALDEASAAVRQLTILTKNLADLTDRFLAGEGTAGQLIVNDELYRHLVDLSGSMNDVMSKLSSRESSLGKMLESGELYDRLLSMTSAMDTLATEVTTGQSTLGKLFRSDSLYRSLASVAARADSVFGAIQAGEGAMGQLVTDDALYEELLRMLVDLNSILTDLRTSPQKYIPPIKVF